MNPGESQGKATLSLHAPAVYQIRLQGELDQSWEPEIGMEIVSHTPPGGAPVATFVGELPDQAALLGILNRFYGLGYPLLSVTCLSPTGTGGLVEGEGAGRN